jgi:predicted nuclease of predicted toxin-antitoxin system
VILLLADENFNGRILSGLFGREPGLDLIHVRDVGLATTPDSTILEWAAAQGRVLLTHDRKTIPSFAYARVMAGRPMPGVFLVSDDMPIGLAIDEVRLAVSCLTPEECRDAVRYFPI